MPADRGGDRRRSPLVAWAQGGGAVPPAAAGHAWRPPIRGRRRLGSGSIPTAEVGPLAVIGESVVIGPRGRIGAMAVIGDGVVIGRGRADRAACQPVARTDSATVSTSTRVRGLVRTGSVSRSRRGFHYGAAARPRGDRRTMSEIGANTAVDRGALEDTVIGAGTRIDNLVQIAHNVRIGSGCVDGGAGRASPAPPCWRIMSCSADRPVSRDICGSAPARASARKPASSPTCRARAEMLG